MPAKHASFFYIDNFIVKVDTKIMDLIEAVIENDIEKVKKLLEQGMDPNLTIDDAKLTPLHFAAQSNALEIAKLLITAGAKIDSMTTPDLETPLDVAKIHNHSEMVNLLLTLKQHRKEIIN